ncbi:MAG: arginine N-succinyltransferase, partial [Alphaproteobacteria bacterium]|nr:arginine N-succinyltransferase [Alphaproteobacteria bacterium]
IPHPTGRAAMRMLELEGFAWENYIDIFDGGPTMTARTDQIRSIREAQDVKIMRIDESLGDHKEGEKMLVAHGALSDFRAAYGWLRPQDEGVALDPGSAALLGVGEGDVITQVARW